jgi:hypothetical protein
VEIKTLLMSKEKSMKKRLLILVLALVAAVNIVILFATMQNRSYRERLTRIPESQSHQHVSLSGEFVEHIHTYHPPPPPESTNPDNDQTKHPIFRVWEKLDLEAIRRDYQPYTVSEMIEKWEERYIAFEYPPRQPASQGRLARLENFYPKEEWFQDLMDLGYPFLNYRHYTFASQWRGITRMDKEKYDNPEQRARVVEGYRLPADATWEEVEELIMKWRVVNAINEQRAKDVDPSLIFGNTNLNGIFRPFSGNTVYVYISDDKTYSSFYGVKLTKKQQRNLKMFGITPKGIHVIYTDEKGRPLPAGTSPRIFEQQMKVLEEAQGQIEKMLADHEAFLKAPFAIHNTQQQFEKLQELHGGDLPRDLKALQKIITELEAVRQEGEEMMQPKKHQ